MAKLTFGVEFDANPEDAERLQAALLAFVAGGIPNIGEAKVTGVSANIAPHLAIVRQLSRLETWDERCANEAIEDEGLEDRDAIIRHIANASADSEYLVGQDEALEGLIAQARQVSGTWRGRNEIVDAAMAEAGLSCAPEEDEDLSPGA